MTLDSSDHAAQLYAARVRAARGFADQTQEQLAERLGVAKQTVKRWENAASSYVPDAGRRIAIATICRVPPEFMEHGFGTADEPEILQRLDRIEALLGFDSDALTSVRGWVREQIAQLSGDAGDGGSAAPTPQPSADPRRAARQQPPARSRRRS